MIFSKAKKYDFQPEYAFSDGQTLSVIEETRLLGIQLTTDLKWYSNTQAICKKAMSRMWLLRRMKLLDLEPHIILDYYMKEIRVLAEQGVPIWNAGLTSSQIRDIERIQKVALKRLRRREKPEERKLRRWLPGSEHHQANLQENVEVAAEDREGIWKTKSGK